MEEDEVPAEGTWCDTYASHFPVRPRAKPGRFDRDVGSEGYDRGTGREVPHHPRLKRPGTEEPERDPFEAG